MRQDLAIIISGYLSSSNHDLLGFSSYPEALKKIRFLAGLIKKYPDLSEDEIKEIQAVIESIHYANEIETPLEEIYEDSNKKLGK